MHFMQKLSWTVWPHTG